MPGHKGVGETERFDITEICGADVLYHAEGIIRESEQGAAGLFGSKETVFSAEGSSLSIRAMLYLVKLYAAQSGKRAKFLAARNAHRVFISAAALLDLDVEWIYPEANEYISCTVSAARLDEILSHTKKPTAVYITSPDYLGNISDIKGLADVCHRHGVLLLVDNAHGAYLHFLKESLHPLALGADLCCDSAHKTLPALTGGGYMHIAKRAPDFFAENSQRAMAMFASTSPSYLILRSLDALNPYLDGDYRKELDGFVNRMSELKSDIVSFGYSLIGSEPLKITVFCKEYGYTGTEIAAFLEKSGIYAEFADPDYLVLMLTPQNTPEDLYRVRSAFKDIKRLPPLSISCPVLNIPEQVIRPHDAITAPSHEISAAESEGEILADITVSCPPAVPIVSVGERIGADAVLRFRYYGIEKVTVIK